MAELTAPGHAMVRVPIAPMYGEPYVASPQISQRLSGHLVDLLDQQEDWFLARGMDRYEGWIHRGFLAPVPQNGSKRAADMTRISLGCFTRDPAGQHRSLPLGARLSPDEVVQVGTTVDVAHLAERFPRDPLAITRSAQVLFEGTPYLWGGITPWGADCSGFVQTIYGLHDVPLPRDAWQQSEVGTDAGGLDDLQAADLAFFSDREDKWVTHVAIALGSRHLVHLALGRGGYHRENIADTGDDYVAALRGRFLKARRVLPR
ncbi:MAG TPA: C40 family peptidase [Gemmatimonadaceae bacterium]|nr:C40 family peptidase [Gemmatimonadaceae bacterium]